MKSLLAWHKTALANSKLTEAGFFKELERAQAKYNRLSEQNRFYALQLKEAEARGLTAFDSDKFMVQKAAK